MFHTQTHAPGRLKADANVDAKKAAALQNDTGQLNATDDFGTSGAGGS